MTPELERWVTAEEGWRLGYEEREREILQLEEMQAVEAVGRIGRELAAILDRIDAIEPMPHIDQPVVYDGGTEDSWQQQTAA